jgi:streptogramin lyase
MEADTVDPLPVAAGVFYAETTLLLDVQFYSLDPSGANALQGAPSCPWLAAMDTQPDGTVIAVGGRDAQAFLVDPRSPTKCVARGALPEIMAAVAVRPDGHVFTVSKDGHTLYELDDQLTQLQRWSITYSGGGTPQIDGIDFAPDGMLYANDGANSWVRIDPATGVATMLALLNVGDIRDDIDIDANGIVRELSEDQFRTYDLTGKQLSGVELDGGTFYATAVVAR